MRATKHKLEVDGAGSRPSERDDPSPEEPRATLLSFSIDAIADAHLQARLGDAQLAEVTCDQCGERIEGEPSGRGLYLWTRGDEMRVEEPALCAPCSVALGVAAMQVFGVEEDEG